jgi:hypothetical protein
MAVFALVASCAAPQPKNAGFEPPPGGLATLSISPKNTTLNPSQTRTFTVSGTLSDGTSVSGFGVQWSATGGSITSGGVYSAGSTPGTYRVIATEPSSGLADTSSVTIANVAIVSITVAPTQITLQPGQSQQFDANALLADGSTDGNPAVTWTATGGSITSGGTYTAGNTAGNFRVIATSGNGKADTSSVTISNSTATVTSVSVTPASVSVVSGRTQQFTATATLSDGSTASVPVTWNATGGSITNAGRYTAGNTAGNFRVIAATSNGHADTSAVTVTTPTITAITLTPASVTLAAGQTRQFSVTATLSSGGTQANPPVTWTATGGTISGSGLYTAGTTLGAYQVIATAANGKADTSAVTIKTITSIAVTPATATVPAGFTQQFSATATFSDGSTQANTQVTWGATGGTISAGGVYTAGSTTGNFAVAAVTAGGLADTSEVTITPPPPVDTTLTNQPAGMTVLVNEPWDTRTPSGWTGPCSGGCASHVSVVADATAPRSPANVLQFTYQGVSGAGDGVGQIEKNWSGVTTLYLAFWFKHSSNWRACDSGINKMIYFGNASPNDNIINFEGGSVTIFQQNGINDHGRMGTGAPAPVGRWHFFEMVATIDGRLAQWVDGVSNGDRSDLRWQSGSFTAVDVDPIWGGGCSGSPAAGQTFEIDHLYISGK